MCLSVSFSGHDCVLFFAQVRVLSSSWMGVCLPSSPVWIDGASVIDNSSSMWLVTLTLCALFVIPLSGGCGGQDKDHKGTAAKPGQGEEDIDAHGKGGDGESSKGCAARPQTGFKVECAFCCCFSLFVFLPLHVLPRQCAPGVNVIAHLVERWWRGV